MSEGTVLVRVSRDLFSVFGTRSDRGHKMTLALGDAVEHVVSDDYAAEPVYEVVATETSDATWSRGSVFVCLDHYPNSGPGSDQCLSCGLYAK